ncbi:MAG: Bug family tripartite tricarboxylate transporter substrate binding protein [Burkholderiales bacterium]
MALCNRSTLAACALALATTSMGEAAAQAYPTKPLRWIIPFAAGGPLDVISRTIAAPLATNLGQPVVVENRAAAAGIAGAEVVAKAAPDGYTLLTNGSMVPQRFLYKTLPYDLLRDFAPITLIGKAPMVLYAGEGVPARDLKEFIAYAKANPGKMAYASSGLGQPFHLAMEMFKSRTSTDLLHVPYKGAAQVIPEFIAGRVQAIFFNAVEQLTGPVRAGKLKGIAVTGERRVGVLPDTPTFDQAGMREFEPTGYVAVYTTGGSPKEIVDRLNREIVRVVMSAPDVQKIYERQVMNPVTNTPEQFAQSLRDDIERWGPLIKNLGVTLD